MAITRLNYGSSFTNLVKSDSFLDGNSYYVPPSFESIATATGTGSGGTITFSSIPQTYKHLQLRLMFLGTTDVGAQIRLRFNSDTGTNYAYHNLVGAGADGIGATGLASQDTIRLAGWYGLDGVGTVKPAVGIIDIHDYSSSTKNKTVRYFGGKDNNVDGAVDLSSGLWISTSAVDSITVYMASGDLATSSIAALYGITG